MLSRQIVLGERSAAVAANASVNHKVILIGRFVCRARQLTEWQDTDRISQILPLYTVYTYIYRYINMY